MVELKSMTGRERTEKIMEMRFTDKMKMREIANCFGVTKQRIFQVIQMHKYPLKPSSRTFPLKMKIIFDDEVKTLLTRY